MRIAVTYTFAEFFDGIRNSSWSMRMSSQVSFVLLCFGVMMLPLVYWVEEDANKIIVTTFLPFIAIMLFWSAIPLLQAWFAWRGSPNAKGEVVFRFDEEGVRIQTENTESLCKWATFIKLKETRRLFLLFPAKRLCHILPKRAFASEADIAAFRELTRQKIKK